MEKYDKWLLAVSALRADSEAAHGHEDDMLWDFIRGLATGEISVGIAQDIAQRMAEWDRDNEDRIRWYA